MSPAPLVVFISFRVFLGFMPFSPSVSSGLGDMVLSPFVMYGRKNLWSLTARQKKVEKSKITGVGLQILGVLGVDMRPGHGIRRRTLG
jgi:hypothetical protein